MYDRKKVHKYPGPFTHILLGLRSDQHLTRFSKWKGPVWERSASAHFKLNWFDGLCGVRSVENEECGKCGLWKRRCVKNAECGNFLFNL